MPDTPAITPLSPEDITNYIGESTGTMDIEKLRDLNHTRKYIVCGDGRTRGKEVDRNEKSE
ncbi:MAG: hypothetical protein H6766_08085 [Candidatus Peribacteria bacterium]|nr:MAG: hypothetical protein H6766_08085 [Candidatus Peribacteria bacterium]